MKLRLAFVGFGGVAGLVFACSGSGSSGSGNAAGDSQSFITEICNLVAPCCAAVNKPTDGVSCRAFYALALGASTYDSSNGNACLNEIRSQSSTPDFCSNPTRSAPSCKRAFVKGTAAGAKQPGDTCSEDSDCASSGEGSAECVSTYNGTAETKTCQVQIEGKAGDTPCLATRDGNTTSYSFSSTSGADGGAPPKPLAKGYICDVATGSFCDSKTKVCTAIGDVGAACESDRFACVKTAFCDTTAKKCAPRKAVGEDCTTSSQSCVDKANCDTKTRKCVAGLADGAPCTSSTACASTRCVNGLCEKDNDDLQTQVLCGN